MGSPLGIFRQAISDTDGVVDVSYLALFMVMAWVLGAITFLCVMSVWVFWRCKVSCAFDMQAFGMSVGAICAGFATALGALAGYELAVGRERNNKKEDRDGHPQ